MTLSDELNELKGIKERVKELGWNYYDRGDVFELLGKNESHRYHKLKGKIKDAERMLATVKEPSTKIIAPTT